MTLKSRVSESRVAVFLTFGPKDAQDIAVIPRLFILHHPRLVQQRRENPAAPDVVPVDLTLTPEHRWPVFAALFLLADQPFVTEVIEAAFLAVALARCIYQRQIARL